MPAIVHGFTMKGDSNWRFDTLSGAVVSDSVTARQAFTANNGASVLGGPLYSQAGFVVGTNGIPSGPTWTSGSGVPSGVQPNSSFLYSNINGTTGSRLYISAGAGVWSVVA
jgi:hypothetical protein